MVSIDWVRGELTRFIASESPEVICITGAWGVGKTFAWKSFLASAGDSIGMDRYSYVSLFGIRSLEELKYAIFEATVPRSRVREEASVSTLKDLVESAEGLGRKGAWLAGLLPGLSTYFATVAPAFFLSVRRQLICLDDLERRSTSLDIGDVLGLISFLKEQRKCSVVVLLNSEILQGDQKEQFNSYLEKVVDRSIIFDPTPSESAEIAIYKDDKLSKYIRKYSENLKIKNIRIIRSIEYFSRMVEPETVGVDEVFLKQLAQTMTLLVWSLKEPSLAPSIDFIEMKRGKVFDIDGTEFTEEERRWEQILIDYDFGVVDDFDKLLLEGVRNGYMEMDKIRNSISIINKSISRQALGEKWRHSVEAFMGEFFENDRAKIEELYGIFRECAQVVTPGYLSGFVRLLKDIGEIELAQRAISDYMETHDGEDAAFFDIESAFFSRREVEPDVLAAFERRFNHSIITKSAEELLDKITKMDGWLQEDLNYLATFVADDFYRIFKTSGAHTRHRVLASLRFRRVVNASNEMAAISNAAEQALRQIASESTVNRAKVRRYGVDV